MLTVLLLTALVVTGTVAYCRHALIADAQDAAALDHHLAHEAAQSGLAYARQALASGELPGALTLDVDAMSVSVAVTDLGSHRHAVRVGALRAGLGVQLAAELETGDVVGDELPSLTAATAGALAAGRPRVLRDGETLADSVVLGDIVITSGARVTLRDVVVLGSIVSQGGLVGAPFVPADGVVLTVSGGLRVDGQGAARGLAVYLPAGRVEADSHTRLEWHGAVVASSLELAGAGSLVGLIATELALRLPPSIDRPGAGRGPDAWPTSLEPDARQLHWMAFPAAVISPGERAAIAGFDFTSALAATAP